MDYGLFLQVLFIVAGVLVMVVDVTLLAKRKLSEPISVTWGFVAIVFIIAGIVLRPNGWVNYMSPAGMVLLIVVGLCMICGLFLASCHISEIMRKQAEMAMNISLLNQEIVELKKEVAEKERELEEKR